MICYIFLNSAIKIKVVDREPLTEDEQQRIIREFHENPLGGHQGIARTHQRISQQYHWKGMRQMIKNYILSCATCQFNKTTNRTIKEPLVITTTTSRPFEKIFMDIVGFFYYICHVVNGLNSFNQIHILFLKKLNGKLILNKFPST
ncbi:Zinc finger, H2C2-type, histone UAS binding [Cinara cedri]|uniref:Zinc finger, H2C2-type, histone UAS binding n=1 Tax=Cinara cedri TaxID=506608 RepID=A0A5E4MID4_9HEMI|nr:Zinc finger, H2C2-type, histone UAS binding [Cinara cedri]